ncbi:hypothetical protein MAR_013383 [Mya arenaria]|uniref:Uncharacterized protein n=1 Tax=Mya arenaria TaxID=6604 RepID=A0ABY7G337_MYAAR|nr:hypothetical protein MAR_013383 [Mya arenaria]
MCELPHTLCDMNALQCRCEQPRIFDGSSCIDQRTVPGSACSTSDCQLQAPGSVCLVESCVCNRSAIFDAMSASCVSKQPGDLCETYGDCNGTNGAYCDTTMCPPVCRSYNETFEHGSGSGQNCATNMDCQSEMICFFNQCIYNDTGPWDNEGSGYACMPCSTNDECSWQMNCNNGECVCISGLFNGTDCADDRSTTDGYCTDDTTCYVPDSYCDWNLWMCVCPPTHRFDQSTSMCIPRGPGDICNYTMNCSEYSEGAVCNTHSCPSVCEPTGGVYDNTCWVHCTNNSECNLPGMHCDQQIYLCTCENGMIFDGHECRDNRFHDSNITVCTYNTDCTITNMECDITLGICVCSTPFPVFDEVTLKCRKREQGDLCRMPEDCDDVGGGMGWCDNAACPATCEVYDDYGGNDCAYHCYNDSMCELPHTLCDMNALQCRCEQPRIFDGSSCIDQRTVPGSACSTSDCQLQAPGSVCLVESCVCNRSAIFDAMSASCVSKQPGDLCESYGDCNGTNGAYCDTTMCPPVCRSYNETFENGSGSGQNCTTYMDCDGPDMICSFNQCIYNGTGPWDYEGSGYASCEVDEDCGVPGMCLNGTCKFPCASNEDCSGMMMVCDMAMGQCIHNDTGPWDYEGSGYASCEVDEDCGVPGMCLNGTCKFPCASNEDCSGMMMVCDMAMGQCIHNDTGPWDYEGSGYSSCIEIIGCGMGFVCVNGTCYPQCASYEDCPDNSMVCDMGICVYNHSWSGNGTGFDDRCKSNLTFHVSCIVAMETSAILKCIATRSPPCGLVIIRSLIINDNATVFENNCPHSMKTFKVDENNPTPCTDSTACTPGMICDMGICVCGDPLVYDEVTFQCRDRVKECNHSSECELPGSVCNPTWSQCECEEPLIFDGSSCIDQRSTLPSTLCTNAIDCQGVPGAYCVSGSCACNRSETFMHDACVPRGNIWNTIYQPCNSPLDCHEDLVCMNDSCQCLENSQFDYNAAQCVVQQDCHEDLDCKYGLCLCPEHSEVDYTAYKCIFTQGYCRENQDCDAYLPNSECTEGVCGCPKKHEQTATGCNPITVLGSNCTSDEMCSPAQGICEFGVCVCDPVLFEWNGFCYTELPDIDRRSTNYHAGLRELLISDLHAWDETKRFNIGPPIMTEMADGETLQKNVTIRGIDDEIPVNIQKCGPNFHVELPSPPIAFAAYCLNLKVRKCRLKNINKTSSFFVLNLDSGPTSQTEPLETARVAYIDNVHCHTYGPVRKQAWINATLTEDDMAEYCSIAHLGFELRCSYSWSESLFDVGSQLVTSPTIFVGESKRAKTFKQPSSLVRDNSMFYSNDQNTAGNIPIFEQKPAGNLPLLYRTVAVYDNVWKHPILTIFNTPIGCKGNSSELFCDLEFKLKSGETCPPVAGGSDDARCGVRFRGLTKTGLDFFGSWANFQYSLMQGGFFDTYTFVPVNTTGGYHTIDAMNDDDVFTEEFCQPVPAIEQEHGLWDSYTWPPIKLFKAKEDKKITCSVGWDNERNLPVMRKINEIGFEANYYALDINEVGEYLSVKSATKPVEAQIKTKPCTTSTNGVCVCAFTYRDGNKIYTVDICDDVTRDGFTFVGDDEDESTERNYDNYHSNEAFADLDGLCSFESFFKDRSGLIKSTSDGFMDAWHYNENYFKCGCPQVGDIPNEPDYVEYAGQWVMANFTSGAKCDTSSPYEIQHSGEEWLPVNDNPLIPSEVNFESYLIENNGTFTRYVSCEFEGYNDTQSYEFNWYWQCAVTVVDVNQTVHTIYSDSSRIVNHASMCGDIIYGRSSLPANSTVHEIKIVSKNNNWYQLKDTFKLKVKVWDSADASSWMGAVCYSNNDPRILTFDQLKYSIIQTVGWFTMYKHKHFPVSATI